MFESTNTMLVPGMYTTVMIYEESRPILPSHHKTDLNMNPHKAYYYGHSGLITMESLNLTIFLRKNRND